MNRIEFEHHPGVKPTASDIELGRGADGVVVELADHPELVLKTMNHPFRLGANRVRLVYQILQQVNNLTGGVGSTLVFNADDQRYSWLVRERVFDIFPRGSQAARDQLIDLVLGILPNADVNRHMLPDPTFDNVRWGTTAVNPEPRWILIDP